LFDNFEELPNKSTLTLINFCQFGGLFKALEKFNYSRHQKPRAPSKKPPE